MIVTYIFFKGFVENDGSIPLMWAQSAVGICRTSNPQFLRHVCVPNVQRK